MDKRSDEEVMQELQAVMKIRSVSQMIDQRNSYLDWLKTQAPGLNFQAEGRIERHEREIQMLKALGAIVGFDGTGEMRRRAHERAERAHEGTDSLTGPGSPERVEDSEGAAGHH